LTGALAVGVLLTCSVVGQDNTVQVYSTYVEADGMRFASLDELRTYLLSAPKEFFGIHVRDCAAKSREQEVATVVAEVLFKRLAQKRQGPIVQFEMSSIACP
jgi:hypothetical protein